MTRTRFALVVLATSLFASAASAYTPYSQQRQDHPSIDAMVASMSSSDINGTFNRISAMLERAAVRDLGAGANEAGLLPENFERGMVAALQDLQDDIKDHAGELTLEEKGTLLQVIDVVVVIRLNVLHDGWQDDPCIPTAEDPCPDIRPAVIRQLDTVLGGLRSFQNDMLIDYNSTNDPDEPLFTTATTSLNYSERMDTIRATFLTIKGVESIDD
jgi:hypothetical protein